MSLPIALAVERSFVYQAIHNGHYGGVGDATAVLESAKYISNAGLFPVFPDDLKNLFFEWAKRKWSRHVSAIIIGLIYKILESNCMSAASFPLPVSVVEIALRRALAEAVQRLGGDTISEAIPLEHPAVEAHGDWSTPLSLQVFGQRHNWPDSQIAQATSPRELANTLTTAFQECVSNDAFLKPLVERVEVAGPGFINIVLSDSYWLTVTHEVLSQGERYGKHTVGDGQTWEVEHTSPNPNKAMHLGHLRTNVTGMAMANIWEAMGMKVIRDSVDNNRGISIAKLMWGYLKFARRSPETPVDLAYWAAHAEEWHTPESAGIRPDRFMDEFYVLAAADCEANPEIEQLVRQWVVDWEAKDPLNWKLWAHVLDYIYLGQNLTLARLHNHFDHIWHEHEHYQAGKDLVQVGLDQGVFKQLEDGAIITNLEKYNLADTVVQKKDGTALYITQDLALTKLKKEKYQPDRMVWVVGSEQSLALNQMFAVCDQLGIVDMKQCEHLSYGFMSIKGQGKMSSRKGNTIFIDDLLDMARDSVRERIQNDSLSESEKDAVAELLAESAVKYAILKVGRTTDTQFDLQTSISLEGDSGPYIQYTHARCQSILRQVSADLGTSSDAVPLTESEYALLRWINRFPEAVAASAAQAAPNLIAQYLYELAQRFNAFYAHESVLQAETTALQQHRVAMVASVAQILQTGCGLLGFAMVEKM